MARAFLFVLDSVGIGGAKDAARYGDEGANTLGHITAACEKGQCDSRLTGTGPLKLPNMMALGLPQAMQIATGFRMLDNVTLLPGAFHGAAEETSSGKDTPSGHWEIAGLPVTFDWGYFPKTAPCFPAKLVHDILQRNGLTGILGNCHASGTEIIDRHGEEHIRTGMPICYTSSDSVFQIAAHETHFGLEQLYALCEDVRALVDPLNIGRVIARPFIGESAGTFERTSNRRDYAVPPHKPTLLDRLKAGGREVIGVGKIGDIFAQNGLTQNRKASGNMALFDTTLSAIKDAPAGGLVFSNFVDFDMLYGHRRDVPGYAAALETFDARLPEVLALLEEDDLLIITADHGCDPTWPGTDHTRERVPIIGWAGGAQGGDIGLRTTFADIAATIADHLDLEPGESGRSFYKAVQTNA
ncbi:phosphopentomutase [Limoniibacter endophyticus]|uniref:Phosphopentomutase n=1 Tax=Limoniibacter endophyticus TaxID=1565040 RepID=A0A8J3DHC8_9HYPH|nr:phosphopentomutase [Limoniibacter endophyticus]GHC67104.1 phosphopentomutase [Limoniibacter endophyticus]